MVGPQCRVQIGAYGLGILTALAAGCGSQPVDLPSPQAEPASVLSAFSGVSIDYEPFRTPAEMANASELVVEGRLARFQQGRELVVRGTDRASADTVVMVISDVVILQGEREPSVSDVLYVELTNTGNRTAEDYTELIPMDTPVLAYLDPAWDGADPADESLRDPSAGRPEGAPLFMFMNPQSLVLQAGDQLVWPMLGVQREGQLEDARPNNAAIAY